MSQDFDIFCVKASNLPNFGMWFVIYQILACGLQFWDIVHPQKFEFLVTHPHKFEFLAPHPHKFEFLATHPHKFKFSAAHPQKFEFLAAHKYIISKQHKGIQIVHGNQHIV
jgi:hypothetical protein